ncbi:hypothetical protein AgCh_013434 [Apium graveolens]
MEMGRVSVSLDLITLKVYYGDSDVPTELNAGHTPVQASGSVLFSWFGEDVPVPSLDSNFVSRGSTQQHMNPTNLMVGQRIQGSEFVVRAPLGCFFQVMIQFHVLDQQGLEEQSLGESSASGYITDNQPHVFSFYETTAGMNVNLNVRWRSGA